jgi:type I restriction enzyme, R subunit
VVLERVRYRTAFFGASKPVGQLVAPSKATALLYKRFLDEFGMVSTEVLISPPDTREGNDDAEEGEARGKRAVNDFWEQMMKRFGTEARYQKELTTRFKTAEEPEIIVVVDKLLLRPVPWKFVWK